MHLVGASIVACTGQQQVFAQRPETQQTDAELALQPSLSVRLQVSLDRIANVRGHVMKVRHAVGVPAHALTVVLHTEIMPAFFLAASNDDRFRPRIDAVFHQLGHRLEGVALRQGDDGDRVPVVSDAEIAAGAGFG